MDDEYDQEHFEFHKHNPKVPHKVSDYKVIFYMKYPSGQISSVGRA